MKLIKLLPYLSYSLNFSNSIINNSNQIELNNIQPRSNTVGFRGDSINNKRAVVWAGDNVEFKFNSETQNGSNQFCIWNEWYFYQDHNLNSNFNNNSYDQYASWKCLNFWGDDSKNQNSHNIKNALVLQSVSNANEGFYNLQYNYKSGGTLGIQNHIFSAYPFRLCVVPNNIAVNLSASKTNISYGEKISLKLSFVDENIYKYIDENLLFVNYRWKVFMNNKWIELANNGNQILDISLDPGDYKIKVEINCKITNKNNLYNPEEKNINSKIINIHVSDNLKLNISTNLNNDNSINLESTIYYKNEISDDSNLINWAWYKYNKENKKYNLYSANKKIKIDLNNESSFIFNASSKDGKEIIWSNQYFIKPIINTASKQITIDDFDYINEYSYTIFDSNNQIYQSIDLLSNKPITLNIENQGTYKICINTKNGDQIWRLIVFNNENQNSNTNDELNQGNDKEQIKNKKPFYKQPWFYVLIGISLATILVLIVWLIIYIKKRNTKVN